MVDRPLAGKSLEGRSLEGASLEGKSLEGTVALVAGATRGAGRGIATELGAAGATVYVAGRSTAGRRSEVDRPETIEGTAELVEASGGTAIAAPIDLLEPAAVQALIGRIETEQGRLDVLVNSTWGGDHLFAWDAKLWDQPLDKGLRMLRVGLDTHLITSHFALPLLTATGGGLVVEMTDGTAEYNANYRADVGMFYDFVKSGVIRLAMAQAAELRPYGATAVAVTPGWLRSEGMLDFYQVTEENWRDATEDTPHFAISESPRFVGRAVAALAADPDVHRWTGQALSSGYLAGVYDFTDLDGSRPDCWRYVVEVQDAGKPADTTGYR